jgi:hypothetical protein
MCFRKRIFLAGLTVAEQKVQPQLIVLIADLPLTIFCLGRPEFYFAHSGPSPLAIQ